MRPDAGHSLNSLSARRQHDDRRRRPTGAWPVFSDVLHANLVGKVHRFVALGLRTFVVTVVRVGSGGVLLLIVVVVVGLLLVVLVVLVVVLLLVFVLALGLIVMAWLVVVDVVRVIVQSYHLDVVVKSGWWKETWERVEGMSEYRLI